MQPVFASSLLEDAAILALKEAKHSPTGTTLEHGGMIYGHPSADGPVIKFIEPNSGGQFDGVQVVDKSLLKPGDVLLATYHVHLCMNDYYVDRFSSQDVVAAIFTRVPEFMLDECTGDVHEFDVSDQPFDGIVEQIRATGKESHLFGPHCEDVIKLLPTGKIVGNIGETETKKTIKGDGPSTMNPCVEVKPPAAN